MRGGRLRMTCQWERAGQTKGAAQSQGPFIHAVDIAGATVPPDRA